MKIVTTSSVAQQAKKEKVRDGTFQIDCWAQLDRYLMTGSESNKFYGENVGPDSKPSCVDQCIQQDAARTLNTVVAVSEAGRALKNEPALYVLAKLGSDSRLEVRKAAYAALPAVARIGTHLFAFMDYIANDKQPMRGFGRSLRTALSNWYNSKPVSKLVHQVTKYQSRNGWSHRDVLRLAHPKPITTDHGVVYQWVTDRNKVQQFPESLKQLEVAHKLLTAQDLDTVLELMTDTRAERELIPTNFLKDKRVWEKLLPDMKPEALIRNLGKLSSVGLTEANSVTEAQILKTLLDPEGIKRARLHPLRALLALRTYAQGHGDKGSLTWPVNQMIVRALEETFYRSFQHVTPIGKKILVALDVSGSMGSAITVPEGKSEPGKMRKMRALPISHRDFGATLAMTFVRTEEFAHVCGFSQEIKPLKITMDSKISSAIAATDDMYFGSTDCGAAFKYAVSQGLDIDCFVVITDCETNSHSEKPSVSLQRYRNKMKKPDAKLVVVATGSHDFTIADPSDSNMLDCCGFDAALPQVITEFIKG
jgi:60 kDa SS-A/Ro ribonucleoprotein